MPVWIVLPLLLLVLAGGCNRRKEAYVPPDQEPPAPERPVRIPSLATSKPSMTRGPGAMAGAPQRGQPGPAPAAGTTAPISGVVKLADGVTAPESGVLFISVFAGQVGGPPLAAVRTSFDRFPMGFSVGPENVIPMGPPRPFAGDLTVTARIDADGNASTRSPEDLVGQLAGTVQPGATGLEIVLAPAGR